MGLRDYQTIRLGQRQIIAAYRGETQVFGGRAGDPVAPTVSSAPVISGDPVAGETLSVSPGIYGGYPSPTVTRQWRRGSANISGATGLTYTLTATDVGKNITCRETAANSAGSVQSTSAAVGPIEAAPVEQPAVITAPAITGTLTVGQPLTASEGSWTGSPDIALQWLRNGAAISGATGATYVLTPADTGANISVRATATNEAGSATATSPTVGPVVAAVGLSATGGEGQITITSFGAPSAPEATGADGQITITKHGA
ncbi:hypothetical protein D2T29_22260 [Sinirhodobacter populi]|uniref:Ig-like domain-containing protein n=1 Tax=Paenirhodobacter populi TaxID=2306993 RepID=A0A443JXK7_9RHOB|nr:hypothetical protein [Sinirhodobacter populi]RWR25215.1 hypothetical protein D2T29_22260 [Sinirhodobacter populi]